MALQHRRSGIRTEQRAVGQDQRHRHRCRCAHGIASGDPRDERVGHGLAAISAVGACVGALLESVEGLNPFRCRQVRREMHHGVRCGTQRDGAIHRCPLGAVGGPLGVEAIGDGLGFVADAGVAHPGENAVVPAQFDVQAAPVGGREVRGFAHDDGRALFGQRPALQRGQGVGHVVHQHFGHREMGAALVGRVVAGQADLGAEAAPLPGGGHTFGGVGGAALGVHQCRAAGLARRGG